MPSIQQLSAFFLLASALAAACSRFADPWEETQLSRDTRAWRSPGGLRHPSDMSVGKMEKHFGWFGSKPNLYDLHHPQGALAVAARQDGVLVLKILEAAKLPVRLDPVTGITSYDELPRRLWLHLDKTAVELPTSRVREALPHKIGILSLTAQGQIRASDGEVMSSPLALEDVTTFAAHWGAIQGVSAPKRGGKTGGGTRVEIDRGEVRVDGRVVALDDVTREVAEALSAQPGSTLHLKPAAGISYGEVMHVLDQIWQLPNFEVSEPRLALPQRPARAIRPQEEAPAILVLKADTTVPFERVDAILRSLGMMVDRVALITTLDLADRSRVGAETYPGGLPGGLIVPIAPVEQEEAGSMPSSTKRPTTEWNQVLDRKLAQQGSSAPNRPAMSSGNPTVDEILHVGGDVRAPEKVDAPPPEYTEIARKARIQGVVILQAVIGADGLVKQTKILKGLPMGLDEEAIKAVQKWRYKPATLNGRPVAVYYNIPLNFRLQ